MKLLWKASETRVKLAETEKGYIVLATWKLLGQICLQIRMNPSTQKPQDFSPSLFLCKLFGAALKWNPSTRSSTPQPFHPYVVLVANNPCKKKKKKEFLNLSNSSLSLGLIGLTVVCLPLNQSQRSHRDGMCWLARSGSHAHSKMCEDLGSCLVIWMKRKRRAVPLEKKIWALLPEVVGNLH